jgi:hypothetical protein
MHRHRCLLATLDIGPAATCGRSRSTRSMK